MPHDPSLYPKDWKQISHRVKFERAGLRCEWHDPHSGERCGALHGNPHPRGGSLVVLAAAHLCRCEPKCGDMSHLLAVCQEHHLLLDSKDHVRAAAQTRRQGLIDAGQGTFEGLGE